MAKKTVTTEDIYADRIGTLSVDERRQLREILNGDLFIKFLRIVECFRPSLSPLGTTGTSVADNAMIRSTIALSELRGWESHKARMLQVLLDPKARRETVQATYPSSGTLEEDKTIKG